MSPAGWTHAVCDRCWADVQARPPNRMYPPVPETCCRCGDDTMSGIYVRAHPREMTRCAHDDDDDTQVS